MILHVSNQIFCQCQFLIPAFLSSRPSKDQVLHIHLVTQVWITINCSQSAPLKTDHWKKNIILLPAGLVYVPPWHLHKQCPALPLASHAACFATRASACGACGSGLNSLPSPTGRRFRTDSPSKFHLCSYNLWAFLPLSCTDQSIASLSLSLSLSLYLFSPLPIGIVGRNFMFLAISFNNSRNDNTISNIQYPIYNIQYSICNIKQTSDEIKEK